MVSFLSTTFHARGVHDIMLCKLTGRPISVCTVTICAKCQSLILEKSDCMKFIRRLFFSCPLTILENHKISNINIFIFIRFKFTSQQEIILLPKYPDRPWGPPSFLFNRYRGPFPG